jgi:inhibitor of cysteine peptidase
MPDQVFTKSMHGKEIDLAVNEPFTVALEEIASTGYCWHVELVPGLALISSSSVPYAGRGVGGGGHRQFVMAATTAGKIPLRAKLWREWEGEQSVIERFEITVQAR